MSYTGADLIADALAQLGVEHVFGIVSIHNMPMMDAINRLGKTKTPDGPPEHRNDIYRISLSGALADCKRIRWIQTGISQRSSPGNIPQPQRGRHVALCFLSRPG